MTSAHQHSRLRLRSSSSIVKVGRNEKQLDLKHCFQFHGTSSTKPTVTVTKSSDADRSRSRKTRPHSASSINDGECNSTMNVTSGGSGIIIQQSKKTDQNESSPTKRRHVQEVKTVPALDENTKSIEVLNPSKKSSPLSQDSVKVKDNDLQMNQVDLYSFTITAQSKSKHDCAETETSSSSRLVPQNSLSTDKYDGVFLEQRSESSKIDHTTNLASQLSGLDEVSEKSKKLSSSLKWQHIRKSNLNVDHSILFTKVYADYLFKRCEEELQYFVGDLAKVFVFGKWHSVPRKQVAYGDTDLTYTFSGNTVCALPWTPLLSDIREQISDATGFSYNFVLINRYNDGQDYMGEHKDDEKDLSPGHPIASLSLGQTRDFVFRHQDTRRRDGAAVKNAPANVTVPLVHGMVLVMKHPTNSFWYHGLPKRAGAKGVRINMTFRQMDPAMCRPLKLKASSAIPSLLQSEKMFQ